MLSDNERSIHDATGLQKKGYSTAKMLNDILKKLGDLDWVVSSAVIRRDGILMASNMSIPSSTESKRACGIMGATIVGAAKNITTKCRMGFPKQVVIAAKEGDIIISEAGTKALLICVSNTRFNDALMMEEINKAAQRIAAIV